MQETRQTHGSWQRGRERRLRLQTSLLRSRKEKCDTCVCGESYTHVRSCNAREFWMFQEGLGARAGGSGMGRSPQHGGGEGSGPGICAVGSQTVAVAVSRDCSVPWVCSRVAEREVPDHIQHAAARNMGREPSVERHRSRSPRRKSRRSSDRGADCSRLTTLQRCSY